nr:1-deoxy-D-xylulose-5-phosphate synthase [Sulfurovaceae bacterium]
GIAESNAVNIASGLALSGKIVYVYSIIPFVTMRPFEQIRVNLAYMNTNVRLVGVGAGVTYGPAGATHHAIEDLAIMRALPNMTVFSPSDPWEVEHATKQSINHKGPIYFRLSKKGEPIISDKTSEFQFGKANLIQDGYDISIIFTGNASDIALEVSAILSEKYSKSIKVVSMHSIKPFDSKYIADIISKDKPIFTIEEHSIIGGLGSIVSEYIAESKYNPIFKRFALPDKYSHYVGSQKHIRSKFNFTSEYIINAIIETI